MSYKNIVLSEVLRHLSDGEWHTLFSLHERFRLSPISILEVIDYLKNKDVIQINGMVVKLTPINDIDTLGELRKALQNRNIVIEDENNARFTTPTLGINQVYLPNMSLLSCDLVVDAEKMQ
jgi:hypothetical protein